MSEKQRYFIELAYNGTGYHGWQVQPNAITVQEVLDKALATVLRQPTETIGCGRTDTGVHATQFFAHFDAEELDNGHPALEKAVRSLNSVLPDDIGIKRLFPIHAGAHARFDATQRSYEYHIHFEKDPFRLNRSWELRDKPDIALMNAAAKTMMEYTDFSCFSKSNTQTFTNNCKIVRAEWVENESGMVFHISADRFLRNMVRAIVGTLMEIGRKEMPPENIREIIESKNRSNAGTSVPACGLYLTEVKYPYLLGSTI
ncbi:tRNA pseudouridine(38-40) synthase TruA [Mucilaginibacter sp.]|uniref:tRNA pseudouridine(38-40) synthase TruA n=1 Tax=Mucilaginibacter sp. TaxID=1882438 RepID=UPI002C6AF1A5|nr:tRNA pseudouridine(38-40) synthase TruA [Mucilaginibacter sp.]HTI61217.1 tRNA pseudouridine(38-40) synthase TruA [Mucilaginibacter sp.]